MMHSLTTAGTNYNACCTAAPIIPRTALWLHTPPCRCTGVFCAFTVKPQKQDVLWRSEKGSHFIWHTTSTKLVCKPCLTLERVFEIRLTRCLINRCDPDTKDDTRTPHPYETTTMLPHVKKLPKSAGPVVGGGTLFSVVLLTAVRPPPLAGPRAGCAGVLAGVAGASSPGRSVGSAAGTAVRARSSRGGWRCPGPRTPAGTPGTRTVAPVCAAAGGSPGPTCA